MADEKFVTEVEQRLTAVDETGPAFLTATEKQKKYAEALGGVATGTKLTAKQQDEYNKLIGRTSQSTVELEKSSNKLTYAFKGMANTIPGLHLAGILLKNTYLALGVAIGGLIALSMRHIRSIYEVSKAQSDQLKTLQQTEQQRRRDANQTEEEIEKAPKLVDALQSIIDKRKEDLEWIDAANKARLEEGKTGIEKDVAEGKMSKEEGIVAKRQLEEAELKRTRAAKLKAMQDDLKDAEDHLRKLQSVELHALKEQRSALESEKKKAETESAAGAAGLTLTKSAADDAAQKLADWEATPIGEQIAIAAVQMTTPSAITSTLRREFTGTQAAFRESRGKVSSAKGRLGRVSGQLSANEQMTSQIQGQIENASGTVESRRSALGREMGEGQAIFNSQLRAGQLATSTALVGTPLQSEYERSIAPAGPSPRRGLPSYPDALRRADRARATVASLESQESGGGSAARVEAVGAQLRQAREELARFLAIMEDDASKRAGMARQASEKRNVSP